MIDKSLERAIDSLNVLFASASCDNSIYDPATHAYNITFIFNEYKRLLKKVKELEKK